MNTPTSNNEVLAVKDGENERPIPSAWRPVLHSIVDALVARDYGLERGIRGVASVPESLAIHMQNSIRNYGAKLVALPEETWNTSVCMWYGNHWQVLVDLWTDTEGPSDLVLYVWVTETSPHFEFEIQMVYVP